MSFSLLTKRLNDRRKLNPAHKSHKRAKFASASISLAETNFGGRTTLSDASLKFFTARQIKASDGESEMWKKENYIQLNVEYI